MVRLRKSDYLDRRQSPRWADPAGWTTAIRTAQLPVEHRHTAIPLLAPEIRRKVVAAQDACVITQEAVGV